MDERETDQEVAKSAQGQQMFTVAVAAEARPRSESLSLKVGGVEVLPYLAGTAAIGTVALVSRAMFGGSKDVPEPVAPAVMDSTEFERLITLANNVKGIKTIESPSWWNPPPSSFASDFVKESKKLDAEFLLTKIEQQKNLGLDYSLEDIIKLRGLCQEGGVTLKPKTVGESPGYL
jgi:hypothetical protein